MDKFSKMNLVEQWEYLIEKRKEIEEHVNQRVEDERIRFKRNSSRKSTKKSV